MPQVVAQGYDIFGGLHFGTPFVKGFQRRFDAITGQVAAGQEQVSNLINSNTSAPSRDLGGFGPPGGSPSGPGQPAGGGGEPSGLSAPPGAGGNVLSASSSAITAPPTTGGPGPGAGVPRSGGPRTGGGGTIGGRRGGGISPGRGTRDGGSLLNSR